MTKKKLDEKKRAAISASASLLKFKCRAREPNFHSCQNAFCMHGPLSKSRRARMNTSYRHFEKEKGGRGQFYIEAHVIEIYFPGKRRELFLARGGNRRMDLMRG